MNPLTIAPYALILLANLLYLYMYYEPDLHWVSLFLFNFLIMALAGIFITLHVNILLHKWLVEESDKGRTDGKLTKKEIIRKKIRKLLSLKYFIEDLFNPGNEMFLVKVYLGMTVFKWMWSLLPGVLVGLLFGLYYQFKSQFDKRLDPILYKIKVFSITQINKVLVMLPRHKRISTLPPTL